MTKEEQESLRGLLVKLGNVAHHSYKDDIVEAVDLILHFLKTADVENIQRVWKIPKVEVEGMSQSHPE